MSTRRPHTKSRKGCTECRNRHIKCDENHPSCFNCLSRLLDCSFRGPSGTVPSGHPPQYFLSSTSSTDGPATAPLQPSSSTSPETVRLASNSFSNYRANEDSLDLKLIDLELLHHFSTVTYKTIGRFEDGRLTWQNYATWKAFSHIFLLRGLLAFSALHLSYLNPDRADIYLARASMHHDKALKEFHDILEDINESNFEAAFLFSTLLVPHALASSRFDRSTESSNSIFDWLFLLRGVRVVLETFQVSIRTGPLGPLVVPRRIEVPTGEISKMRVLREAFSEVTKQRPLEHVNAYRHAIDELETLMLELESSPSGKDSPDMGIIIGWLARVSEEFSACLRQRTPESLVILAHYATTLRFRNDLWWLQGRDVQLISAIEEEVSDEWRGWLDGLGSVIKDP